MAQSDHANHDPLTPQALWMLWRRSRGEKAILFERAVNQESSDEQTMAFRLLLSAYPSCL